jgi:arylformamidase
MTNRGKGTIIDISIPLVQSMPSWPGSAEFRLTETQRLEDGDSANVSKIECEVHAGTHVDAPSHFLENGLRVDQLSLDTLVGPAVVAFFPNANAVTADELEGVNLLPETKRLLLRTGNSHLWRNGHKEFKEDYVALTPDGADWIVEHGIRLVGIDYLSIARYEDTERVHKALLGAEVVVVEGLNLLDIEPGNYELICLPLRLADAEGAPARVVLRKF